MIIIASLIPAGLALVSLVSSDDSGDAPNSAHVLAVPVLSISHPTLGIYPTPGVPYTVYINVTDTDGDLLTITWDWGDGTANDTLTLTAAVRTMVPMTHTWDPYVEQGTGGFQVTYTMTITVDDGTGNVVSGTRPVYVTIPDNIGPFLYVSAPTPVDPDDLVVISAAANDTEGDSLTWTFIFNNSVSDFLTIVNVTPTTAPDQMVWNNQTVVLGAEGTYTVSVSVSDALGINQVGSHNNTQNLTIVALGNDPPYAGSINIDPSVLQINDTLGYLVVRYSIEVQDSDGDPINATWDFGDGSPPAYNETAGTNIVYLLEQWVNYTNPGTFNVSIQVTDSRPDHTVTRFVIVEISSSNLPPSIWEFQANYSGKSAALPNQTVNFTLIITDPELNPVFVIVDFGDNSSLLYLNLTEFVESNVSATFNHTYSEVGNYTVLLRYTDGKLGIFNHSKEYNITVVVFVPPVKPVFHYTWWDYTSMGLFAMIPVLMIIGYLRSRRTHREIEAKGMTVDEWKLFQEVMDSEENKLK
jgi:PKD domain